MKDCSLVNATDRGVSIHGIGKSITIEGMYISNIANECINVAEGEIIKLIDSEITFSGTALWVGNAANIFTKNNLAKSLKPSSGTKTLKMQFVQETLSLIILIAQFGDL